jgi:peptidoglycan/xylan/chitin deacetylase (PgdA/CDA1 family)
MTALLSALKRCTSRFCALAPLDRLLEIAGDRVELARGRTGRPCPPFIRVRRERKFQVLVYHRVHDDDDPMFPAVPVKVFGRQMEILKRRFRVLGLEEALDAMESGGLPRSAVVVTFDDGYRDNYLHAFPILEAMSIPATIFLATEAIGSGKALWHDRVFDAFRRTAASSVELAELGLGKLSWTSNPEKRSAMRRFLRALKALDGKSRMAWVERIPALLQVDGFSGGGGLMLSWEEVGAMAGDLVSFGSHTRSHPILSRCSLEELRVELGGAKADIESRLGKPAFALAYPNGTRDDFDDQVKGVARDAGYRCALTTIFGTNHRGIDRYELRRGGPDDVDAKDFGLKMRWYRFAS